MESIDLLPPEKTAFIAYSIGVYESVQKFGGLITSGKITYGTDNNKIAELLLESSEHSLSQFDFKSLTKHQY